MLCSVVVVDSDRHTLSVSLYRYPESRDEQKPGPERRDCEAFVIPPKGLMQWPLGHSRGRNLSAMISVYESGSWQTTVNWLQTEYTTIQVYTANIKFTLLCCLYGKRLINMKRHNCSNRRRQPCKALDLTDPDAAHTSSITMFCWILFYCFWMAKYN